MVDTAGYESYKLIDSFSLLLQPDRHRWRKITTAYIDFISWNAEGKGLTLQCGVADKAIHYRPTPLFLVEIILQLVMSGLPG